VARQKCSINLHNHTAVIFLLQTMFVYQTWLTAKSVLLD